MTVWSRWLGAGVVAAGVSLQVLGGISVAWADDGAASTAGTSSDSGRSVTVGSAPESGEAETADSRTVADESDSKQESAADAESSEDPGPGDGPEPAEDASADAEPAEDASADADAEPEPAEGVGADVDADAGSAEDPGPSVDAEAAGDPEPSAQTGEPTADAADAGRDRVAPEQAAEASPEPAVAGEQTEAEAADPASAEPAEDRDTRESSPTADVVSADPVLAVQDVVQADTAGDAGAAASGTRTTAAVMTASVAAGTATGASIDIIGTIIAVVFSVITALEQWAAGPPSAPAGSTVTVRTSSLQLTDTLAVPADWYFPEATESGQAPQQIIFLAHGFFGVGAMYSYTAAQLAESTGSIVVVPTITSNPFAAGGLWINGAGMQTVVADLFAGDRSALTASALAAGYAQQYGLAADAELPQTFALAGHSAGGSLVTGAVSHLDADALDDLAGVLLFDAVTTGDTVADALATLDGTGRFIPVREIGSPWNLWNFPSNVNTALSTARSGHFTGVVLAGGTHADSIQGGGALIRAVLNVLVGMPLPQNEQALIDLAGTWLAQWFAGVTDADDDLVPGSTLTIATAAGPATATVIGSAPAADVLGRPETAAVAV